MKKIILYTAVFLSCFHTLGLGQLFKSKSKAAYFSNAEKEYGDERYIYAVPFYKSALKYENIYDSLASLHLAESYWRTRNYDSADAYYRQFEDKFGALFSTNLHLAELLATHKRYDGAAMVYKRLLQAVPLRFEDLLTERLKGFSNVAPFLKDSLDYSIHLLHLNTDQQDFSPQYFKNGLVFISNRYPKQVVTREFGWDGLPFANIYWVSDTADLYLRDSLPSGYAYKYNNTIKANDDYTKKTSNDNNIILANSMRGAYTGEIHRLAKFSDDLSAKYNYGPLCFNKQGTTVYFTRNSKQPYEGRYNLEICESNLEKGQWTHIRVMPFVQPAYDFYHPAITSDGERLYFCSNQPGGIGGSDIYYVSLASEAEKKVIINPGVKINTAGNELFPTIHGDDLYFSSDGYAGLGGLDLFKLTNEKNNGQTPLNLGYPINSSFDDFGIIYNTGNTTGLFTSNRLGSDDIYKFTYAPFLTTLRGTVLNRTTLSRLDNVKISMRSESIESTHSDTVITDITGNFNFHVKPGQHYTLQFTRNGYLEDSLLVTNTGSQKELPLQPFLLQPIIGDKDGDGIVDSKDKCPDKKGSKENSGCPEIQTRINDLAKMVFFKTASAELLPVAFKPLNDVFEILVAYPNTTLHIEGHTDNRARLVNNQVLSERRANAVKRFFVKKGISTTRFTTAGYGLRRPIADNTTEEGRALNRRVAMKATFH